MRILLINAYQGRSTERILKYKTMLEGLGEIEIQPIREFLDPGLADVAIISGSELNPSMGEHTAFSPFIEFLKERPIPILGICFGHQALASVLGYRVRRYNTMVKGKIKLIFKRDPILAGLPAMFEVDESHRDYVYYEPGIEKRTNTKVLSTWINTDENNVESVEMFRANNALVYGVQFHVERMGETGRKLVQNFLKLAKK